jgi:hypothetical protein
MQGIQDGSTVMKNIMMSLIVVGLMVAFSAPVLEAGQGASTGQTHPEKPRKQRTQVLGQGRTSSAANSDARSNAAKVVGTYNYSTVSQQTTGKDDNWTCSLIVEYEVK